MYNPESGFLATQNLWDPFQLPQIYQEIFFDQDMKNGGENVLSAILISYPNSFFKSSSGVEIYAEQSTPSTQSGLLIPNMPSTVGIIS